MASSKDRLVQWLRDAHAMEEQAETMLTQTAQRIEHYPSLKQRIEQHVEETRRQARRLEQCLERLNGGSSGFKDAAGKLMGLGQAMSGLFAGDEVVKASLASYSFEHMEIASYRILIATADECGDAETRRVCEENLAEEEAMAKWLEDNLSDVTRAYLSRDASPGASSKH
jgi:ferritin-like metal-binding protein YciE